MLQASLVHASAETHSPAPARIKSSLSATGGYKVGRAAVLQRRLRPVLTNLSQKVSSAAEAVEFIAG